MDERVEAAAKAMWDATRPGIAWDELREASREPIRVKARAALTAADAVVARTLVTGNYHNGGLNVTVSGEGGVVSCVLPPGHDLIIEKRRGT
jgi:hypothetical protein